MCRPFAGSLPRIAKHSLNPAALCNQVAVSLQIALTTVRTNSGRMNRRGPQVLLVTGCSEASPECCKTAAVIWPGVTGMGNLAVRVPGIVVETEVAVGLHLPLCLRLPRSASDATG